MMSAKDRASAGSAGGSGLFRDMSIRSKLLFGNCTAFVLAISLGGLIIYSLVQKTLESSIESELGNSNAIISNMVKTSADISIKNYLRAVAEDNKAIVNALYERYLRGELAEAQARQNARDILLSQPIGKTGYIYCVDSKGVAAVHRNPGVEGRNWSSFAFVQEQMKRKEGYLEYEWKNPGEPGPRPKSLHMTYFKPWDWIISASCYREEFIDLVSVDDISRSILGMRFGKTGYSYIIDGKGNAVVHPAYKGNLLHLEDRNDSEAVKKILKLKTGKLIYDWKNPDERVPRKKLVIMHYIPEFDWIVGSSIHVDELYAPLYRTGNIIIAIIAGTLILILPFTIWISSFITSPLHKLMGHFSSGARGDFSVRMDTVSRDEIGRLAHFFNFFMEKLQEYSNSLLEEIRKHKKAQDALRSSEYQMKAIVDGSPIPQFVIDRDHRVIHWNRALEEYSGIKAEDIVGTNRQWRAFYSHERPCMADLLVDGATDRIPRWYAGKYSRSTLIRDAFEAVDYFPGMKGGTWLYFTAAPIRDADGGIMGAVETLNDITEIKRYEKALKEAYDKLEEHVRERTAELKEANEEIRKFAYFVSHDLRAPLINLRGFSAELRSTLEQIRPWAEGCLAERKDSKGASIENAFSEEIPEALGFIETSVSRMDNLINAVLQLSRIGRRELDFERIDMQDLVRQVLKGMGHQIDDRHARIIVEELPSVVADMTSMEQIMTNLIDNAVKYLSTDRKGEIRIWGEQGDDSTTFHIRDNGRGIAADDMPRVFELFRRVGAQDIPGYGMGLNYVQTLIRRHGGRIWCESEPGSGTTFSFTIADNLMQDKEEEDA